MAKRKKKKTKAKSTRLTLRPRKLKKKKTPRSEHTGGRMAYLLKIFAILCVLAAIGVGLLFLEQYVKTIKETDSKIGTLELVNVPAWAGNQLIEKIHIAAGANGEDFQLDEDAAQSIGQNLSSIVWLEDIRVQTIADTILIAAKWRKPIGLIRTSNRKFYIDSNLVILNYLPTPKLPIVELKGALGGIVPDIGEVWLRDDLAAAVEILKLFESRDDQIAPQRPLLYEIASIDVSNFDGRKNWRQPHILLYAKDGTEIRSGAEVGNAAKNMEAAEDEKLAMLYGFYKDNGTLQGIVKYIELRHPRKTLPQPIDNY